MCSGCSGDYAGGFDFDDPDDPIADAGDRATSASFRGTNKTDLGETDLGETDLGEMDLGRRIWARPIWRRARAVGQRGWKFQKTAWIIGKSW